MNKVFGGQRSHNKLLLRGKDFLFSFYWVSPILGSATAIILLIYTNLGSGVVSAILGGSFGFCYFLQKQKLEEAAFFQKVFSDFNARYDAMNENLSEILSTGQVGSNRSCLIDYFNLCAEEYLLYKRGYIPLEVWESWRAGMFQYWSLPEVQSLWVSEIGTASYYGFDPAEHFPADEFKQDGNSRRPA
jgi:hypothetical protein